MSLMSAGRMPTMRALISFVLMTGSSSVEAESSSITSQLMVSV